MDNSYDNDFEKFPGAKSGEVSGEQLERATKWEESMSDGVPEFAGDQFGIAKSSNEFYGETIASEAESESEEQDQGISDAAALINYGLDAAARIKGVEYTVQVIKNFDTSGKDDPIRALFADLGVNTPEETKDIGNEFLASKDNLEGLRESMDLPLQKKSAEGALVAINNMKELISEVEGADPEYEGLREGARAVGKGYFEYAVSEFGKQGLVELFSVLNEQGKEGDESNVEEEENAA